MKLAARIEGVGLAGPGLAGWKDARYTIAGHIPYAPSPTTIAMPDALPAVERRRAGKSVRLALAVGLEATADADRPARELAAVFTSSTGDGDNLHAICETLASDDRLISPTRFHNSVHNAPSGYWGIATGAMLAADSIAAYDGSFGAGLIEAAGRVAAQPSQAVLLIAYDAPYPEPLHATRPLPDSFAVALVLSSPAQTGRGSVMTLEMTHAAPSVLADASLEAIRRGVPAARSLPLLRMLARGETGRTTIEYLDGLSLAVEVSR